MTLYLNERDGCYEDGFSCRDLNILRNRKVYRNEDCFLNKVSFISCRYPSPSTISDQNGNGTSSTELSCHPTGKLLN